MSQGDTLSGADASASLITPARRREMGRIVLVGVISLLYWQGVVPLGVLLVGVAIGLYPLARMGLLDLWHQRKLGTELFVTFATQFRQHKREVDA